LGDGEKALIFHFDQLIMHDRALLTSVMATYPNGSDANSGGGPKSDNARSLPTPIAFFLGSLFIVGSVKCLFYAMDRDGYLLPLVFGFGFIPFCLGVMIIFSCFLPDPPTIFGLLIGS